MRILQISDTHLGAELNARGPRGWSRAADHHEALRRALEPALREEVDLVIHAGDVFDRSLPPRRWVHAAGELLSEVARRVPVLGIAGNHDRRGIRRWLPQRALDFVDQPTRTVIRGVAIARVPFRRDAEGFARAAREAVGPGADVLVMHQAPHGSRVGPFTFRVGVQRDTVGEAHLPDVPFAMCGHIHPRQSVRIGGCTVVMGGSTERTAFSEAEQAKGVVRWELGAEVSWRFVDHPTRPMEADVPGALMRCGEADVERVRAAGRIAVVRRDRGPTDRWSGARGAPASPSLDLWARTP